MAIRNILAAALLALWSVAASAQTSCTVSNLAGLVGQFSDSAGAGSITPANVRNVICSAVQVDNNTSMSGRIQMSATASPPPASPSFIRGDTPIEISNVGGVAGQAPLYLAYDSTPTASLSLPNDTGLTMYANDSANTPKQLGSFHAGWENNNASTGYSYIAMHPVTSGGASGAPGLVVWGDNGSGPGASFFPTDFHSGSNPANNTLLVHGPIIDSNTTVTGGATTTEATGQTGVISASATNGMEYVANGSGDDHTMYDHAGNTVFAVPHSGGGIMQYGAGSFTANGSVATALSSIGPTGAHTTVQEWLTIQDAGGTTRYIPAF